MFMESQREKIIEFAKERVSGNDSFHDMEHIMRVADATVLLAVAEHADMEVCWTAAMLHDICKREQGDHAEAGAKAAEQFLASIGMDRHFIWRVSDAIRFHNKDFDASAPVERQVLWDSDKLYIMTPDGFARRMLPYWIMKKGSRKAGIEAAVAEYYFYKARFHTKTGIKEASRHSGEMERYLNGLKSEE
jgi:HD superfamily phosphodiesterase